MNKYIKYSIVVFLLVIACLFYVHQTLATYDDPVPGGVGRNSVTTLEDVLNMLFGGGSNPQYDYPDPDPDGAYPTATPDPNIPTPSWPPGTTPTAIPTGSNGNLLYTGYEYPQNVISDAEKCLVNKNVYIQVHSMTDIPAYIIGGMHAAEASCNPNGSCVSGRAIGTNEPDLHNNCTAADSGIGKPNPLPGGGCGFTNLLDSCVFGANFLKKKIGKTPANMPEFANALARYNGTGNANCGRTPFKYCPPRFEGSDHVYPMNKYVKSPGDIEQQVMYLVYCTDGKRCCAVGDTSCVPPLREKIGVLPMAAILDRYL